MTSRVRAVCRPAGLAPAGEGRLTRTHALVVTGGLALLALLGMPAPAVAQWGKLEKLSGPGPFYGWAFEFRVACFGEYPNSLAEAEKYTVTARASIDRMRTPVPRPAEDPEWQRVAGEWLDAARAWAAALDTRFIEPRPMKLDQGILDYRQLAIDLEALIARNEMQARAMRMATSSAGVLWSLCKPDKERRFAVDAAWNNLEADGDANYAEGAPIELDTLMGYFSWRFLANTKWDFLEASTGAGVYWFTSTGFRSLNGVILQPARVTLRAPSTWSAQPVSDFRRWLAIPVIGFGATMFPEGFEPNDFAGVGDRAVRIPAEVIFTRYIFLNLEPFLHFLRK